MPAVRLRIRPDRTSALVGVNYQDIRSILTLADLEAMASLDKARKSLQSGAHPREDQETIDHYTHMRAVIKQCFDAMSDAFTKSYNQDPHAPPPPLKTLSKEERWRRVREEAAFNKAIDNLINATRKKAAEEENEVAGLQATIRATHEKDQRDYEEQCRNECHIKKEDDHAE